MPPKKKPGRTTESKTRTERTAAQRRQARAKNGSPTVRITLDDQEWIIDPVALTEEISALEALQVRRLTGQSLNQFLTELGNDPDVDTLAVMVWLARREMEPGLELEEVMGEITLGSKFDAEEIPADEVPEPEAPGPEV